MPWSNTTTELIIGGNGVTAIGMRAGAITVWRESPVLQQPAGKRRASGIIAWQQALIAKRAAPQNQG